METHFEAIRDTISDALMVIELAEAKNLQSVAQAGQN